jgi:ribose-phosphate pyrophosphokinase
MKLVGPRTEFSLHLARALQLPFVEMERRVFPDGEINPRIRKAPREVVLVNMLASHGFDPNRYVLEYIFSIQNLRERGTERIVVVMPYLPYSRQDAVFRKGESFTSKFVLEIFKDLSIEDIFAVTFHLHRQKPAELVTNIEVHNVSGIAALRDYLTACDLEPSLFVAPDEEAGKWAREMAESFNADIAVLEKRRNTTTGAIETSGELPEGRTVVIVDDMISTGGTVQNAIEICRTFNSQEIMVCAVHGIFSSPCTWDVPVITTNTIENPYAKADVVPYIAEIVSQEL